MRPLKGLVAGDLHFGFIPTSFLFLFLFLIYGCGDETSGPLNGGPKVCSGPSDCAAGELCDFPDNQCGMGDPGVCVDRPPVCSDGIPACGCDGKTYDSTGCAALSGMDLSAGGGCAAPPDSFACGPLFCFLPSSYCERTEFEGADCDGAVSFDCAFFDPNCAPQDCSCLPGLMCEMAASGGATATKTSPGCPP